MSSNNVKVVLLLVVSFLVGLVIVKSNLKQTSVVQSQEKLEVEVIQPSTSLETTKTVGGTTTVSGDWEGVPSKAAGSDQTVKQ